MKDWGRIHDWGGWSAVRQWNGWRRYGPAAGSVVAHVFVGAAIVSVMAAYVKPRPASPVPLLAQPELQVTLVSETPRPQPRPAERPAPRPPKAVAPDADTIPDRPRPVPKKEEKRRPEVADAPEEDSVFVPPSIFREDVPLGLRNMASEDRCNPRKGLRPPDCGPQWSEKIGPTQTWQLASAEDLKQHYGDIIGPCRFHVGCEPGEWVSSIGTGSVHSSQGSMMMGGAGGLRMGAEGATTRAGIHPDHVDPGFGD